MTGKGKRRPAHITIARSLGVDVVTGVHAPGDVLASELELARLHNVSRSVIREALRMLAAKGLVDSKPRAGTRVRARRDWNLLDPDLLAWMFEGSPPPAFVRMLFELRMIVEPAAAELAAQRRTPAQLSLMGHALESMAVHGLATEAGRAADQQFHIVLLEAAGNDLLASLSGSIAAAVHWTTFFKHKRNRLPRDPMPEHRALFAAVVDADPAAARAATVALIAQAQRDTEASLDS